jgi:hypothetical protein
MHCLRDGTPRWLAALLFSTIALGAQAGRPLQTEDAGVLERGECELEGAVQQVNADGGRSRQTSLQVGCGVGWRSQVAVNPTTSRNGERENGVALTGKTGLWTGAGDDPAELTIAWRLQSTKVESASWRYASTGAVLVYSRPLPRRLTLHANLGHARDHDGGQGSTVWGLALEHAGFGTVAPMAEVFGDDREAPWWNLGLRWTVVPERVFFDASYGRQAASGRPRLVTVGFKLAF